MSRKCEEIAIKLLDVDRHVWNTLRTIDKEECSSRMSEPPYLANIVDSTHDIGDMGGADESGAVVEKRLKIIYLERAVFINVKNTELGTATLAKELPRNDVGMVLKRRDNNLVAFTHELIAPCVGDKVYCLSRITSEDDLGRVCCSKERGDSLARILIERGADIAEMVNSAVYVGVYTMIDVIVGVDYALWFLRRCGIVEIYELAAVDFLGKYWELRTDAVDIVGHDRDVIVHRTRR